MERNLESGQEAECLSAGLSLAEDGRTHQGMKTKDDCIFKSRVPE